MQNLIDIFLYIPSVWFRIFEILIKSEKLGTFFGTIFYVSFFFGAGVVAGVTLFWSKDWFNRLVFSIPILFFTFARFDKGSKGDSIDSFAFDSVISFSGFIVIVCYYLYCRYRYYFGFDNIDVIKRFRQYPVNPFARFFYFIWDIAYYRVPHLILVFLSSVSMLFVKLFIFLNSLRKSPNLDEWFDNVSRFRDKINKNEIKRRAEQEEARKKNESISRRYYEEELKRRQQENKRRTENSRRHNQENHKTKNENQANQKHYRSYESDLATLGLDGQCTYSRQEIDKAYKIKRSQLHSDRFQDLPDSLRRAMDEEFIKVQESYKRLISYLF